MKSYPSIAVLTQETLDGDVFVFDKLDGSNIRAEWNIKGGFTKFGSRKQLIDESHPSLGAAIALVKDYNQSFAKAVKEQGISRCTVFFEFWGPQSFAGQHVDGDSFTCSILDVDVYKAGFMAPADFVKAFEGIIPAPRLLHRGPVTKELVTAVKTGTLPGMTREGVVMKLPAAGRWGLPVMFKVKNRKWIEDVRATHGHLGEEYLLRVL